MKALRVQVQQTWQALSRRERRILRSKAKGAPDATLRVRCKIIISLVRGSTPTDLIRSRMAASSMIYDVMHRFIDQQLLGLADRREDNGDAKVTEAYEAMLFVVVPTSPRKYGYRRPTWTQELLILVLQKKTEIRISRTTMSRLLKRLHIRLGRPKPIVGCPWKKRRRMKRLREIRRLIETLPANEVILYVDEVDIHLNPKIGPDWMLQATQKQVLTPGKNQKRYLAGALNARTGRLTWVEAERKDSQLFILQLWQLIGRDYPNAKRIHLILDNYRIHSSFQTQAALARLNGRVVLHFLPPYCPDHNRIERVWRDLHDNVTRNHQCRNMKQLMAEAYHWLKKKNRQLQRQYALKSAA
jgi:transposase